VAAELAMAAEGVDGAGPSAAPGRDFDGDAPERSRHSVLSGYGPDR